MTVAEFFWHAAKQGFVAAQYILRLCSSRVRKTARRQKLIDLANKRNTEAQNFLGSCYAYSHPVYGIGDRPGDVSRDLKKAVELFEAAARKGHAGAQHNLALSYSTGTGVPQDDRIAVEFANCAAKQGNKEALDGMAFFYLYGKGVPKDEKRAEFYKRAMAQINPSPTQYDEAAAERFLSTTYQRHAQEGSALQHAAAAAAQPGAAGLGSKPSV